MDNQVFFPKTSSVQGDMWLFTGDTAVFNPSKILEAKTITDENDTIKWTGSTDTVKYGCCPDIYRDMTIKEAFIRKLIEGKFPFCAKVGEL